MERNVYSARLSTQALRVPSSTVSLPLVLLLISLLGYAAARKVTFVMAHHSETHGFVLTVFCVLAAIPFIGVRYTDFPRLLRTLVRGIGIVVLAQVLFDAFGPVPPAPNVIFGEANAHALFFRWAALIAVLAGVAAMWRPIFLLPLFYYYIAWRLLIGPRTGIWVTETDYAAMLDAGAFGVIGGIMAVAVTSDWVLKRAAWLRGLMQDIPPAVLRRKGCALVWAVIVGAHLGNYFFSGVAKLVAGWPEPWTWPLANPTQNAILFGLERGDNPLATFPTLLQFSWDTIRDYGLAFNFFVLAAQLLSPLAILRRRWLLGFTLFFDVFHIGVYMTLGALFHFWIAVNLIIYSSVWRAKDRDITPMMKAVCILTVLFGYNVFYTNRLGWLDVAKLASTQFYAVTQDGREIWMPPVYFGIYSYTVGQAATYIPPDHFASQILGKNLEEWHDSISCGPRTVPEQAWGSTLGAVERLVRETHHFMQRHPAIKNYNLYYFYPHHMQPNPWVFAEFNRLRLEEIVGYKYVVELVCLTLEGGRLRRDVRKREEFSFDVR